ncbi:MAG: IS110 family transposase, partial [Firmicutes bacterium]|nr:IS110 family transposase [Bacillota bacterium]
HPDGELFRSLPGAGTLLAARMLGSLGDRRDRYPHVLAVQALAGTAPVTRQSGKRTVVCFRRACDKSFRAAVGQFAFCSLQYCAWASEYYRAKRAAGHGHRAALRELGHIWLRIIYAVASTGDLRRSSFPAIPTSPPDRHRLLAGRRKDPPV